MEDKQRQVKGIWIPIDIWEDKALNWNEKILFLEIDSFTSKNKDCYISNEYISKLLSISETNANKVLSSLIKKGYVIKTSFDGRRRFVKSALTITSNQPCQKQQPCIDDNDNIPNKDTYSNIPIKEKEDKSSLKKSAKPDWYLDFNVYKDLVLQAQQTLLSDANVKAQFEKFNPNCDYELSLEKSVETFWGTEDGWENKKKGRAKTINMTSTLKKNIERSKVYKSYGKNSLFDKDAYVKNQIKELDDKMRGEKLIINGVEYK